jgi:hypothetical protein
MFRAVMPTDGLGGKIRTHALDTATLGLGNIVQQDHLSVYQLVPALYVQDQFLSAKAIGLPSLLKSERSDICRRRQETIIRFRRP